MEKTRLARPLEICVPDIGDFEEVEVVELLVAKGDVVEFDDPLVSIESDKATMEIPSTAAGVVMELRVAEGDRVSEGSVLLLLEVESEESEQASEDETEAAAADATEEAESSEQPAAIADAAAAPAASAASKTVDGGRHDEAEPGGAARGLDSDASASATSPAAIDASADAVARQTPPVREMSAAARHPVPDREGLPHASPLVRRFARELGVPIEIAEGSGPHGRVLVDDLKQEVRARFEGDSAGRGRVGELALPAMPSVDHAAFGPVHEEPLTRIQKVSGPALQRSWLNVPHVTQHDEADVTELERFRRERRALAKERGVKLSPLHFVMKAVALVLGEFPTFRSSLAPEGDRLIVKDYVHLGIAVDTDQGLVVPVVRDVDRKGVFELARELDEIATRARERKLSPEDLKGACFTISSLGGIGGTAFTPIVNAPEVAILGLSRTTVQPIWRGASPFEQAEAGADGAPGRAETAAGFEPRLVLPFSLSYDHRVIDGANAVRFTSRLARVLSDPLQLLL